MLVFDRPRPVKFRRFTTTAHLGSTLPGAQGTEELVKFGRSIGLSAGWLQHPGEPQEHFDLFDGAIDRARDAGAQEITPREFVHQVVIPKRAATLARGGSGPGITSIRPVTQERTGFARSQSAEACVATLLGVELGDVPGLWGGPMAGPSITDQRPPERLEVLLDWLHSHGWSIVAAKLAPEMGPPPLDVSAWAWPLWSGVLGYHILQGHAPDGEEHSVVAHAGAMAWDPHPAKPGLASVSAVWCLVCYCDLPPVHQGRRIIQFAAPPRQWWST